MGTNRDNFRKCQFSGHKAGRTVRKPLASARPWACVPLSVARTAPESGVHGRIADGGGPEPRLGTPKGRPAASASDRSDGL
jgi:hypothetical protein